MLEFSNSYIFGAKTEYLAISQWACSIFEIQYGIEQQVVATVHLLSSTPLTAYLNSYSVNVRNDDRTRQPKWHLENEHQSNASSMVVGLQQG